MRLKFAGIIPAVMFLGAEAIYHKAKLKLSVPEDKRNPKLQPRQN